ncbi:9973_t:CDS:2 [Gigaspora rosea]|nr:9973_t:CDS:2 [Gigaspora rosea]
MSVKATANTKVQTNDAGDLGAGKLPLTIRTHSQQSSFLPKNLIRIVY